MTTLEQKLTAFRARQLQEDRRLSAEDVAAFEVRGPTRSWGPLMFERGIAHAGQTLSTQGHVFMGAYSYMNDGGVLRDGAFVGRYCSIGRRATIGAGMHAMSGVSTHPLLSRGAGPKYTAEQLAHLIIPPSRERSFAVLGSDVWLGDGSLVVAGVEVGTGAVVGANSVVTRDVPPYAVVGGIPAKVIRYRHPPHVVERLLASAYWELPLDRLRSLSTNNVFAFLDECAAEPAAPTVGFETYRLEGAQLPPK